MPAPLIALDMTFRTVAYAALVLAGPLASAQVVTITPTYPVMVQGSSRAFTAERSDGQPPQWEWTIEEGEAGGSIDPDTGLYHAPRQVADVHYFHLRATDPGNPQCTGTVPVMVTPTIITPHASSLEMEDDGLNAVSALRGDEAVPTWSWSVVEPEGGSMLETRNGTLYQPPRVAGRTFFHLRVQDTAHPGDSAIVRIQVVPARVRARPANAENRPAGYAQPSGPGSKPS